MTDADMTVDLLVLGGGMAGMTAAAFAAEHGMAALVIEKQAHLGGSAILSGGAFWTARDYVTLRRINPHGDAERAKALIGGYDRTSDFIASLGTEITEKTEYEGTQSFPGWVRHFDVADWMRRARSSVQASAGFVVTESNLTELLISDGRVLGGIASSADGQVKVRSSHVLLATGGFQNNTQMRAKYLPGAAATLVTRSNPASDGQGVRLGQEAGAGLSQFMSGWYGHTIPYPVATPLEPPDYMPLAQFYLSPRAVLLDISSRRFVDESLGYYMNAQAVARSKQGRALLIFDDVLRQEDTDKFGVDRWDYARRCGSHVAQAGTLSDLAKIVAQWGYTDIEPAIDSYNSLLERCALFQPPRSKNLYPVSRAPFFAMEVQPAITFTHGGLRTDAKSRVLDTNDQVIPGLLAAGADAGGTYHEAYAGGLAMAGVFGVLAAQTAIDQQLSRSGSEDGLIPPDVRGQR